MQGTEKLIDIDSYSVSYDEGDIIWESGSVEEYNGEFARDMIVKQAEFDEIERFYMDNEFNIIGVEEALPESNSNFFSTRV